jgi:hypothetical protein
MQFVLVNLLAASLLLVACGGSDSEGDQSPRSSGGDSVSSGSVAPNTFMTYEGRTFRLVDLVQANLVPGSDFQRIGSTDKADIEFSGRLDVYQRRGDTEAIYTPSKGSGTGEQAIPDLWLRWIAER